MKSKSMLPAAVLLAVFVFSPLADKAGVVAGQTAAPAGPGSYRVLPDGGYAVETNIAELWPGVWTEGTNGLRTQLYCSETNSANPRVSVMVGSVVSNSWPSSYIGPPSGTFAKCALLNSKGVPMPCVKGQGMEGRLLPRIPVGSLPKWPDGGLRNRLGFLTNSPPDTIREFKLLDVFRVEKEDDYTLTICPAIYRFETNGRFVDRLDLPCASLRVRLCPLAAPK
jgi:hypothetical protein